MQFLSAPLLAGLVLASVPLIIHLLNRRRFQLVEWAPMKYLRLTIRNNRRRMRIEQLLLLILRTLLIVLLIVTIARPVLARYKAASWLAHRSRMSRVIVLDDSLSMGYRRGGQTALDLGKQAVIELLRSGGNQDAVTLLTTSPGSAPLLHEAVLEDVSHLIPRLDALHPTAAACNWAATFKVIDDSLSTATFPQKELILVTDLRRSGWSGGVSSIADRWASEGVVARVIDVGSRETADVALVRFVQEDPIVLPGRPAKLMASIRNGNVTAMQGAQAVLTIDGKSQPLMLPNLPAGATSDVPLSVTLQTPGEHVVQLALSDDALPGDNQRFLVMNVRERLDITIVDGRQVSRPFESAGDFLHLALTAGPDPWRVQQISDADPDARRPGGADVMAIADVASLSDAAVAEYEKQVRSGMGLLIFAGEQVDPDAYNDRLFKNGRGLLPGRLNRVIDGPVRGLVVEQFGDSPLSPLSKIMPAALAHIETRRLMDVEIPRKDSETVRVLARWNDPEGHPAVIEKRFGRGRVLLWTLSADREWSDWPVDPTYVLAVRSATVAVARPDAGDTNLVAGHPLEWNVPGGGVLSSPRLTLPDDPTAQPVVADGSHARFANTSRAGVYRLTWNDAAGKQQSQTFGVSFDRSASNLEPLRDDELKDLLGNLKPSVVHYQPGVLSAAGPGREMWRMLATTLLGLFVVEAAMAFWVSRER